MIVQVLTPAVQHRDEADFGTKMLGIGSNPAQRLSRRFEQDRVDQGLVLKGDRRDLRRQREDDVEIGNRQEFALPRGKPFPAGLSLALRAMPIAAGIVGDADRPAGLATFNMAAEFGLSGKARSRSSCGARRARDGRHWLADMPLHGGGDVRHLQSHRHGEATQPGGTTSIFNRSSGLVVRRMRPFETFV